MEIEDEKLRSDFENHVISLKAVSNKVEGLVGNLRSFLSADETDSCRWLKWWLCGQTLHQIHHAVGRKVGCFPMYS